MRASCAICFSQFNNVFRCPKMLHCKHTFCLECLARINVKSAQPSAIQCPLCRSLTPLPALGLPKLTTDPDVLSFLINSVFKTDEIITIVIINDFIDESQDPSSVSRSGHLKVLGGGVRGR
uniref:RING-type domain-containing protein n=1 Tax=Seriola lalandi dorsalis TaxID=1841481 RepID=A0A3B4WKB7_SERLL